RRVPLGARLLVEPRHRTGSVPAHGRAAAGAAPGTVRRRGGVRMNPERMSMGRLIRHPMVWFGVALYVFPYLVVALGKSTFNASEFLVWAIFAVGINQIGRASCRERV